MKLRVNIIFVLVLCFLIEYTKLKEKLSLAGNKKENAEICNYLGDLYIKADLYKEALDEHTQELQITEDLKDLLGRAIAHRRISECHSLLKNFDLSKMHAVKYLNLSMGLKSVIEQQRAHTTIGRILMLQYEYVSNSEDELYMNIVDYFAIKQKQIEILKASEIECAKALELCYKLKKEIPDKELKQMMVRSYLNLGIVCELKNNYQKCATFLQQALKIAKLENFVQELQKIYFSLSEIFIRDGDYAQAISLLEQAVACSEKLGDKDCHVDCLLRKAEVMLKIENYPIAKSLYRTCLKIRGPISNDEGEQDKLKRSYKLCKRLCERSEWLTRNRPLILESDLEEPEDDGGGILSSQTGSGRGVKRAAADHNEKMGDYLSELLVFESALRHYQTALELATVLDKPLQALAPLYFSVSQTWADLKNFAKALDYATLELKCYGFDLARHLVSDVGEGTPDPDPTIPASLVAVNGPEIIKTLRNMCQYQLHSTLLRASETKDELRCKDSEATPLSGKAGLYRVLLATTLNYGRSSKTDTYLAYQMYLSWLDARLWALSSGSCSESGDLIPELRGLKKNLEREMDLKMLNSQSQESEDDVVIGSGSSNSSDTTMSGDERDNLDIAKGGSRTTQGGSGKKNTKSFPLKRNEKGETLLHRACIDGNVKRAKKLIELGHPLNVRDNCGWIPLHEACNYGCDEVVKLLIENGARVNDRGRDETDPNEASNMCDGITPLHDAASVGHVSTMELLIKNGADPSIQDDHGNTSYDTLVEWRLSNQDDMETADLKNCERMEHLLLRKMKMNNIVPRCHKNGRITSISINSSPKDKNNKATARPKIFSPSAASSPLRSKKGRGIQIRSHQNRFNRPETPGKICVLEDKVGGNRYEKLPRHESEDYREIVREHPLVDIISDDSTSSDNEARDLGSYRNFKRRIRGSSKILGFEGSDELSSKNSKRGAKGSYSEYRAAMLAVKRPKSLFASKGSCGNSSKKSDIPALIREGENVVDDWLVPDTYDDFRESPPRSTTYAAHDEILGDAKNTANRPPTIISGSPSSLVDRSARFQTDRHDCSDPANGTEDEAAGKLSPVLGFRPKGSVEKTYDDDGSTLKSKSFLEGYIAAGGRDDFSNVISSKPTLFPFDQRNNANNVITGSLLRDNGPDSASGCVWTMDQSKDSGRSSSPVSSSRPVLRINVLVGNHKLMIPLSLKRDGDKDVLWLAREALKRFYTMYPQTLDPHTHTNMMTDEPGNKILVKTEEGSVLYPLDIASELLADNDTIRIEADALKF